MRKLLLLALLLLLVEWLAYCVRDPAHIPVTCETPHVVGDLVYQNNGYGLYFKPVSEEGMTVVREDVIIKTYTFYSNGHVTPGGKP